MNSGKYLYQVSSSGKRPPNVKKVYYFLINYLFSILQKQLRFIPNELVSQFKKFLTHLHKKDEENILNKKKKREEGKQKNKGDKGNLASSFGEPQVDEHGNPIFANGNGINGSNNGNLNGEISDATLKDKERVFPGLSGIDVINQANIYNEFEDNITLKDLTNNFRNYLAKEEKLYFDVATIRAFDF